MRAQVSVSVWTPRNDFDRVQSWLTAQFHELIWSHSTPEFEAPLFSNRFAFFDVSLDHGGDIQDEECISLVAVRLTKQFEGSAARIRTVEGDLLLFEISPLLSEDIDIPDEVSILYHGLLYHIPENLIHDSDLLERILPEFCFPAPVQAAFEQFCASAHHLELYHTKSLLIPIGLQKLLASDRDLISKIVQISALPQSLTVQELEFVEYSVKFRRFQFALLDSIDVRVPRSFGAKCGEKPFRYVKLSFLLTIGFQNCARNGRLEREIAASRLLEIDPAQIRVVPDDDESWLDTSARPPLNLEEIGCEMAERVGSFMEEISDFEKVDSSGPLNFDFDLFQDRLERFMDSSESQEEEEEDVDELLGHIEDEEEKALRGVADGTIDPTHYVQGLLRKSVESQIDGQGPAMDLLTLFDMHS
jgi:hypothetical protein